MNKKKILLAIVLTILGLLGVATLLTMEIEMPKEIKAALSDKFTPEQIKFVILINPTIMLIVAVIIGTLLYNKVNLKVPVIEKIVGLEKDALNFYNILKYGALGGIISGLLIIIIAIIYNPALPEEFIALGEKVKPTLSMRFLYGGFTEEILLRYGLMTLIVWLFSKIFKTNDSKIYWIGIIVAAIMFAIGHFPIVFQTVYNPSVLLLSYVLIANAAGGLIFGWLYWKKGLESAFIAHIFTHIVFILSEPLVNMII